MNAMTRWFGELRGNEVDLVVDYQWAAIAS